MLRVALLTSILMLAVPASANPAAPALLWGEETVDSVTLFWQLPPGAEADAIEVVFQSINGTVDVFTFPGDLREVVMEKSGPGLYTVSYSHGGQSSTSSNGWGPLGYPHCGPTRWINLNNNPPYSEVCFHPLPV